MTRSPHRRVRCGRRSTRRPHAGRCHRSHWEAHRSRDRACLCRQGYRGHNAPNPRRVLISGQKRGPSARIKRELTRRSTIEAVASALRAPRGHNGCPALRRAAEQRDEEIGIGSGLDLPFHGVWQTGHTARQTWDRAERNRSTGGTAQKTGCL